MKSRWIIVADRSQAHFFSEQQGKLEEVETLVHTSSRLHNRELVSDKQGRASFAGEAQVAHGYAATADAHEQEAKGFAAQLVQKLNDADRQQRISELVLVAEPHMLGLIQGELSGSLAALVTSTIRKDLCHLPRPELLQRLAEI